MAGKVTILEVQAMKERGEKIAMLTAYDYPSALIADACGVDMILVGDSAGTVIQGESTTLPVTMEQMLYHTRIVAKARKRAMVVLDMPFMSYQESLPQARKRKFFGRKRELLQTSAESSSPLLDQLLPSRAYPLFLFCSPAAD